MKIAVIGSGNVGKALSTSFLRAGQDVVLAARDEQKCKTVAAQLGASAAPTPREAASSADIVVLAVPYLSAAEEVAREIAPAVAGKIVIDATNPAAADFSGLVTSGGPSGAEHIAEWLPGARVVKAFNTVLAGIQADPSQHGVELDGLYATDDDAARATVAELISAIGLRPVDVGPLARARELEALAWLNIQLQIRHGGDWRTAYRLVGAPAGATSVPATSVR